MKVFKKPVPIEAVKCIKQNEKEIIQLLITTVNGWEPICEGKDIIGFDIHPEEETTESIYYEPKKNKGKKTYWLIKESNSEIHSCISNDQEDLPLGYEKYIEEEIENKE